MGRFSVEGLTQHSNILGTDENTKEIFHSSIRTIYKDLFGETIEQTKETQKKNWNNRRNLIKERLWLCFEIDQEARKQLYRSLIDLEEYDGSGTGLYVIKLFIKNVVMKPIINFVSDISYRIWWMIKSLAKYYFFLTVTKPYLKYKTRVMNLVQSFKINVTKHLNNLNTYRLAPTVSL